MNWELVLNAVESSGTRISIVLVLLSLFSNATLIITAYIKKSRIHIDADTGSEKCEFHKEDESAMTIFKNLRTKKTDEDKNWRNVA